MSAVLRNFFDLKMAYLFLVSVLAVVTLPTLSSGFVTRPLCFHSTNPSASCPTTSISAFSIETSAFLFVHTRTTTNRRTDATTTTCLHATKKKGGSSASATSATKKVQVKLLKHMAGIGQAGDVVQVTPAFYQNKLRPTQSAVMVTEEQVNDERQKAKEQEEELHQLALKIKQRFSSPEEQEDSKTPALRLSRKAGPGGQLFGGIGPKTIVDELKHILTAENKPNEVQFLDQKTVKIISIIDDKGEKLEQIKHLGEGFVAKLALTKDVSVDLIISVEVEH